MAKWLVAPVMKKVIDGCFAYLKDQVRWQTGMKEELEKLRDIQPKIQALVSAYSQVEDEADDVLNKWYWQLRDAVDEADDVLDDIEYKKLEKQASKTKKIKKVRSIMKSLKKRFVEIGKRALKIDPYLKRLEAAVQKLDQVSAEVSNFQTILEGAKQEMKQEQKQEHLDLLRARETTSRHADVLLGRSNEIEIVRQWLRNSYQSETANNDLYKNISLLSVVGHGGMGKTTLLQNVYDDIDITSSSKEFDVKMWVCVSHNFDAKTVTTKILESLEDKKIDLDSLDLLQRSLQSKVVSKRFLLVLDDIWEDNIGTKWENVLRPLRDGNLGSKILITTRMNSVASNIPFIKNRETVPLKGMEENECLELFSKHAFDVENPNESLKSIARDIVKKLSGCPLATKMIGTHLKSQDESYWRKFLNIDIGNLELGPNGLRAILKLSYTYLPKFLQICFAFCCTFSQDHKFDKDDLVRMWIALGFIESSNSIPGETLEDIGRRYFNILVQKSFFDKHFQSYKMHDLLHDLAQLVSKQEIFRAMNDEVLRIPENIRHLSIHIDHNLEVFKEMGEFKNLRSLSLFYNANYDENFVDVLSKIFEASKSIRLLYINAPNQKEMPEMIGCLTHLRYFYLRISAVRLPRSISQLYHLQFKMVNTNFHIDLLPIDINNLCNLRYLKLPMGAHDKIYEIGKLKFLQELEKFIVKNENGYGIGELEHMNELRKISIYKLENIRDAEEVCRANFYEKKNLTDLSLCWPVQWGARRRDIVDHDLDEKVFDSIQPYNNLKRLCINAYMGVRSARWMNDAYFTSSNLQHIELKECLKWQTLPPFGQLRFLKSLRLYNMPKVEQIDHKKDCTFPSLEVLRIEKLEALQEWFDTTLAAENGCFLPCLTELCLIDCPKLQELPSPPTKLQILTLNNIGWKGCHWLPSIRNCSHFDIKKFPNLICLTGHKELKANENCELIIEKLVIKDPSVLLMEPLRSISSLRFLTIEENDELVSFPTETEQWFLQLSSSLTDLNFCKLQSLQSLPLSLGSLSSLDELYVDNVPQLKLLPNLPASLKILDLQNLDSLQYLPSTISSLASLRLKNIPLLESLPDLPSSFQRLVLEELENLDCLPSCLPTTSLQELIIKKVPRLLELPDLPSSLKYLYIEELENLDCLPSCLSTTSLYAFEIKKVPRLLKLPDLPSSLGRLVLEELENLDCLPSCLPTTSLQKLFIKKVPLLLELPDLPSSLRWLMLEELENLDCLPSCLPTTSIDQLIIKKVPRLLELPELPSYLRWLMLEELEKLDCLPALQPLVILEIKKVPRLLELPELPSSLKMLYIEDCHPHLMERHPNFHRRN